MNKNQFFKIAKVKNEAEFYRKYPTEETFMKAHKKEFKKAAMGAKMVKTQLEQLTDFGNPPKAQVGTQLDMWGNPLPIVQMPLNPNAGVGQLGLNNPQGGVMNLSGNSAAANNATQTMLWGTGGNVSTPGALGGVTPASIKGIGSETLGKSTSSIFSQLGGAAGIGNIAGQIYSGIQGEKNWKQQKAKSKIAKDVSALSLRAAQSTPKDQIRNQYLRPEDIISNPNELFPTYGVGTNYLAKDGTVVMQVGGNLGEIQNTYAPNTLYDNLGYEPLDDSNQVKQYMHGGIRKAQDGVNTLGSFLSTFAGGNATGASGGGDQVGGLGSLINTGGNIISKLAPAGSAVAGIAGPAAAFASFVVNDQRKRTLANNAAATQKNLQKIAGVNTIKGMQQGQFGNFMENGGWVSHDWQPQVITTFGEHSVKDLLKEDPTMDTLRTGGHITQNNMFPTDQYALGGELKTTWGGYAEPISHNPYMPGSGETVMFRGKSHEEGDGKGHTGIGVKYGEGGHDSYTDYAEFGSRDADADVEVERGEPATEMIDGETGEKNMVVFGNLKIPNMFLGELGPEAKNKKFKNFANDLSKLETKYNKVVENATNKLSQLDPHTPFDLLKMNALHANIIGGNTNLKKVADKKIITSHAQNSINETAEEFGIDADALAKGKIKIDKEAMKQQARFGKEIFEAQKGVTASTSDEQHYNEIMDLYQKAKDANAKNPGKKNMYALELQKKFHAYFPDIAKDIIINAKGVTAKAKSKGVKSVNDLKKLTTEKVLETNVDEYFGPRTEQYITELQKRKKPTTSGGNTSTIITPNYVFPEEPAVDTTETEYEKIPKKESKAFDFINSFLPYLSGGPTVSPDPNINPELMALAMNQLEPVKAQLYNPLLEQPYDISLQDQMNANQADFNAIQRQQGYNPEALATLAAQKYAANSKVLAEQFRLNQAEKAGVYGRNRASLNEAQLKDLDILDKQYVRGEEAKTNTKRQAFEAMKSIVDKYDKKRLQDQTYDVYKNMFPNYRFNRNFVTTPTNLTTFPIPTVSQMGTTPTLAKQPMASGSNAAQPAASNFSLTPNMSPITVGETYSPYGPLPSLEDLFSEETAYPVEQKYGGKTKKKKTNGSIVKAIKNL